LNLRPPGYEPGELPDCSTPRRNGDCSTAPEQKSRESALESQKTGTRYDGDVTVADWIALAFLLLALIASATYAGVRGLRLWRSFGSFSDRAGMALDRVTRLTATAEEGIASLTVKEERLTGAIEHLQVSLARLAVLGAAAAEAKGTFDRIRNVVPIK
jgi:hypothetical protein